VMAEAAKQALSMSNPSSILQTAIALKQLGGGDGNTELVKLLMDTQRQNTELLLKAIDKMTNSQPTTTLAASLRDLLEVQTMMDRLGGRGRGATSWVSELMSHLPDLASAITQAAGAYQLGRTMGPRAVPPTGAKVLQMPNPPAAVIEPAPVNTHEQEQPEGENIPAQLPPEVVQVVGNQILAALNSGRTGDAFAESVCIMYGDQHYDSARSIGAAGLLNELRSHPAVWATLAPYETQLSEFLTAFMAYGDDTPEAAPAAAIDAKEVA
jgi:hypothetical protein